LLGDLDHLLGAFRAPIDKAVDRVSEAMRQFEQLKLRYETTSVRLREVVSQLRDHFGEEDTVQRQLPLRVGDEVRSDVCFDGCCSVCGVPYGERERFDVQCNCP
jgi:hypothetical protein